MTIEKITSTPTALGVVDKVNEIIDSLESEYRVEIAVSSVKPEGSGLWLKTANVMPVYGYGITTSDVQPVTGSMIWLRSVTQ